MSNTTSNILRSRLPLRPLKLVALLGLILMAGNVWGQTTTTTIETGFYYIMGPKSGNGYVADDPLTYYYLCPTDGWRYYQANSPYHTITNTGMPFMTTYQCRKAEEGYYDVREAVWLIKKYSIDNQTYYSIRRAFDNKYLTFNRKIVDSKPGRIRVHLEASPSNGNDTLFGISYVSSKQMYDIIAKGATATSDTYKYLNVNKGNIPSLIGTNDETISSINYGGTVGTWTDGSSSGTSGINSQWNFVAIDFLPKPIITPASTPHHYTIALPAGVTLPTGFSIRYTLDENVTPGVNSGTEYSLGDEIEVQQNECLKAWVAGTIGTYDMVSPVDEQCEGAPAPTFEVLCQNQLQISGAEGADIYYTINDDAENPSATHGELYSIPFTAGLSDGDVVRAVAYLNENASDVAEYTYRTNTPDPTVTFTSNDTQVTITVGTGETAYYTTNGNDPEIGASGTLVYDGTAISCPADRDLDLRIIAKHPDRGVSCPPVKLKRPSWPDYDADVYCIGSEHVHLLTMTIPSEKTYWYALSNGSNQTAPAESAFIQYTTSGQEIDITTIPSYDGSSVNVTLHFFAKDNAGNKSLVRSANYNMMSYTSVPTISHTGYEDNVTITATEDATIHYTVDGGAEQTATSSVTVSNLAVGQNHTITAWAQASGLEPSCEVSLVVSVATEITTLAQLNAMTVDGSYVLGNDISDASSHTPLGTDAAPFTGSFDGGGYTISGLTQPLFGTTNNAVVHDVNLKLVDISNAGDTVGAVVCVAKGYTRVYNCGILPDAPAFGDNDHPSVVGGKCAGGIVGSLRDDSRVVNCFSYADVTATGMAAGIVGRNQCPSDASVTNGKYTKLRTMVVNCIFYGDIHTATYAYPVYGGKKISNKGANGINNYNFYSDSCSFKGDSKPTDYYCSWPAKYEYLTRYEFHRYLLNSNRELCGWWVGAPSAPSTMSTLEVQAVPKDASLMAKWVLDRSIAPFPILKPFGKYSSPINIDADASWRTTANPWEGKKLGTLSVTIQVGDHGDHDAGDITEDFVVTDMDTLHGDFCYRKIQLPYYNSVFGNPRSDDWSEKYAKNYGEFVVTGWEIVSATPSSDVDFTADWQTGYNYADRTCTVKDLYSTDDGSNDDDHKGRVFAQGGYYYVPNGVTSITIKAHWAKAYYLGNGDRYYDRVDFEYLLSSESQFIGTTNCMGSPFAPAGQRSETLPNGQTLRIGKIADVAAGCTDMANASVYDYALVLVGNHQYCTGGEDVNPDKSFTIMSADFDMDDEPDYCLEWQLGKGTGRQRICPIRFDFLPVVEIGLALKKDGSKQYYSLGCYHPHGHFEVTETTLIRFGQFEFGDKDDRTILAPLILNGGIYEQYVKGRIYYSAADKDKIIYKIIGGNVYMPSFTPGSHVNQAVSTRHCAVNVIGGRIDNLYLTGNYNEKVTPKPDNPHCYIDGGWFDHVASAGKEGIKGDVTFKINHARIKEFYGGGTMDRPSMIVTGSIDVTVDSSLVFKYCGGPKFGDMNSGMTVTTHAAGTTFGVYYGGGNGGTAYVQYNSSDGTYANPNDFNWATTGKLNDYVPLQYVDSSNMQPAGSGFTGYKARYEMEMINVSSGTLNGQAVNRSYLYVAQYSATKTGTVSNTLNKCIVKTNFYGAGNLGGVNGNVTSELTDTEVKGSVFGAGFSAQIPEVTVDNKDKNKPTIDTYTGIITPPTAGTHATYTWTHDDENGTLSTSNPVSSDGQHLYTEVELVDLGMVTGNVTLTLKGTTKVGTSGIGHVYGGGDESKVTGNVVVRLQDDTEVSGDVFGGGNRGEVDGSTTVTIGTDE